MFFKCQAQEQVEGVGVGSCGHSSLQKLECFKVAAVLLADGYCVCLRLGGGVRRGLGPPVGVDLLSKDR